MNFKTFMDIILARFPQLTALQQEQFAAMDALYREWNSKINVISRKDMDGLYLHHVLHSLAIGGFLKCRMPEVFDKWCEGGVSVLDLGTGGGFPGIPLAVLFPNVHFTLCDSIGKKTIVAREVAASLGLKNVTVVNDRAENLPQKFDFVVSRAVTSLDNFMPWVEGKYNGGVLYLKGGDIVEEVAKVMGRYRLPKGSVLTYGVDSWYDDEYFAEKLVIFIPPVG